MQDGMCLVMFVRIINSAQLDTDLWIYDFGGGLMRSQIHLIYSTGNSLNDIHNKQQLYKTTKPPNAICFFNSNVNLKLITPTPISRSTVHQYNNSWAGIVVPKLINSSPSLIIHYFISIIHYVSIYHFTVHRYYRYLGNYVVWIWI